MAGPPSSSAPERAVASAGSLRYRWSRGSSDQIEHWTARHCSRHEFGVELPQLVTAGAAPVLHGRSEEHTSELQSRGHLVCRLLLENKKNMRAPICPPPSTYLIV